MGNATNCVTMTSIAALGFIPFSVNLRDGQIGLSVLPNRINECSVG
jgi:hypothetical protein